MNSEDPISLCRCSDCPLNGSTRVPGRGTGTEDKYNFMLVGIAPAKEEVRKGSPFVGWSGTVLRKTLDQLGVSDFYLTNTLLCELPDALTPADQRMAIACCSDRLSHEVALINPKLLVALGNVPLEALTGVDYKIRGLTGRIVPGKQKPVLAVIHPASLRRRPEEFRDFADSLRSGSRYLSGTYTQALIPKTVVVDEDSLGDLCNLVERAGLVAVDLETTGRGFYPYGRDPDKIRCIALAVDERTAYIVPGMSSPYYEQHPDYSQDERLKEVLKHSRNIFHNGPFDVGFLKQAGYGKVEMFFDTFLAHYLLDEREYSHSLKSLSHRFLGAPDWEADIKTYLPHRLSSYDLIPDDKLYHYASFDVTCTYNLSEVYGFRNQLGDQRVLRELLMPCANMFAELRHRGLRIDIEYLMDLEGVLDEDLQRSMDELSELAGSPINPFSPKEVAELLYDTLHIPVNPRLGRSTGKAVLEAIGGPVCESILECRGLGKLRSTYVVGMANFVDEKFRIHPFTKLHGTVSGRLATEDPSVMNVTKKGGVKKLYLPEPGHLIAELDRKQMELRCYAVIAKDEHLKTLILEGDRLRDLGDMEGADRKDPHSMVGRETTRRTGKEITRGKAKSGVFGRLYGRGLDSFIRGYGLSEEDATSLIATIDTLFPSIKEYNTWVRKEIHAKGYLESYFGRRRRFGLLIDENKHELYRQGANFLVQSMASDVNLFGMLHLYGLRNETGVTPLFPIHDSIVMDIPGESAIAPIELELRKFTRELVGGRMDFTADIAVGTSWGSTRPWGRRSAD